MQLTSQFILISENKQGINSLSIINKDVGERERRESGEAV